MRNSHVALLSAAFLALFFATPLFAEVTESSGRITGTVAYRERIALPRDAVIHVQLLDVSIADIAAQSISDEDISDQGQPPVSFVLPYDAAMIKPNHRYAVRATIRSADGMLMFTTTQSYPVITNGAPTKVSLLLHTVGHGAASLKTAPGKAKPAAEAPPATPAATENSAPPAADAQPSSTSVTDKNGGTQQPAVPGARSINPGEGMTDWEGPSPAIPPAAKTSAESQAPAKAVPEAETPAPAANPIAPRVSKETVLNSADIPKKTATPAEPTKAETASAEAPKAEVPNSVERPSSADSSAAPGNAAPPPETAAKNEAVTPAPEAAAKSEAPVPAPETSAKNEVPPTSEAALPDAPSAKVVSNSAVADSAEAAKSEAALPDAPSAASAASAAANKPDSHAADSEPPTASAAPPESANAASVSEMANAEPAPDVAPPAVKPATPLADTQWKLVSLAGKEIVLEPTDRPMTLAFSPEGERIAGSAGCNRYLGTFTDQHGKLKLDPGGMTLMACAPPASEREQKFIAMLRSADGYRVSGPILTLTSKGRTVAKFRNEMSQ